MNRVEIEATDLGKELSNLSNAGRDNVLNNPKYRPHIQQAFNVTIEERPFTALNSIPSDWFYLSATDSFRNYAYIAVFKPNKS